MRIFVRHLRTIVNLLTFWFQQHVTSILLLIVLSIPGLSMSLAVDAGPICISGHFGNHSRALDAKGTIAVAGTGNTVTVLDISGSTPATIGWY
jgi:hypothetical protein